MKKLFVFVFLLVLVSISVFAAEDIVGIGYGETAQAAKDDARVNLSSQLSVRISSVTTTSLSDDGKGSTSALLTSYSAQNTSVDLIGLRESAPTFDENTKLYSAECRITEASLPTYKSKLDELAKDIDLFYGKLTGSEDNDSITDKSLDYIKLINLIQNFEAYRYVVQYFDATAAVPVLPVTRNYIESIYQSVLQTTANQMETSVLTLQKQ